jgi:hypothetical protein
MSPPVSPTGEAIPNPLILREIPADPNKRTSTGFVYTKNISGNAELFYRDSSGNVVQITSGGSLVCTIPQYSQAVEPTIPNDTVALWWDTVNSKAWFIWNRAGVQRKVELQ